MHGAIPIKTPEEIAIIRNAGAILTSVLDALEAAVKPGMVTAELDALAEKLIRAHAGARPGFKGYHGFPASLCVSVNNEVVHGIPGERHVLQQGDIVGLDCGVYLEGFHTDACRTVIVGGETDPESRRLVKTTQKALKEALKVVRPGGRVGDISAAIQKTAEQAGFGPVIECTGHGVGRDLHEPPEILNAGRRGTGPELKEGMVLAIEPIINMGSGKVTTARDGWTVLSADGTRSAHVEHTLVVTSDGYEILAR